MSSNMNRITGPALNYSASFDYAAMAQDALRQRDILRQRLQERKAQGPDSPDKELTWRRENSILYNMYLEQRLNHMEFSRRARLRGQDPGQAQAEGRCIA